MSIAMERSRRQLPVGEEIFLDHVGHFVADSEAARQALIAAGFLPTPLSVHTHRSQDGVAVPSGTGNCCVMLRQGYLEILFQTADTPLGDQLERALARYPGVHLAAFSVADAALAQRRLTETGFATQPLVELSRAVPPMEARFTVARVEPAAMPEGRIQILTHHTEAVVWQPDWLDHPNGVLALADLVVVVEAPTETVARWSAFLDRPAERQGELVRIHTERSDILFVTTALWKRILPDVSAPGVPSFPAYGLLVKSLPHTERWLSKANFHPQVSGAALILPFPPALGRGVWIFAEETETFPWNTTPGTTSSN